MSLPQFNFTLVDGEGLEVEVSLPARFEVCSTCEGRGTTVNPAIDGNGISREDFDEDPDFHEAYMRGDYDVACRTCKGQRVVAVVDHDRLTDEQRGQLEQHYECEAAMARDDASERWLRMAESGERW